MPLWYVASVSIAHACMHVCVISYRNNLLLMGDFNIDIGDNQLHHPQLSSMHSSQIQSQASCVPADKNHGQFCYNNRPHNYTYWISHHHRYILSTKKMYQEEKICMALYKNAYADFHNSKKLTTSCKQYLLTHTQQAHGDLHVDSLFHDH